MMSFLSEKKINCYFRLGLQRCASNSMYLHQTKGLLNEENERL